MAVAKRFTMPSSEAGISSEGGNHRTVASNGPFWYSFEYGAAHFTIISTEHDVHKGSPQREVGPHADRTCLAVPLQLSSRACRWAVSDSSMVPSPTSACTGSS